jgi:2-hydroxy-3-keto-5-methylthiopentenyl-1-phosphate phosphatase
MLKTFATIRFKKIEKLVVSGKLPLKEGVRRLVESIPSHRHPEILEQIRKKKIRKGFPEFLDFLHGRKVPIVVISGGLMDSVKARLASFSDRIYAVHAPEVDKSGKHLES